ncbi:MAG: fluoride efflux transporter CrcB [Acidobacteriota bacterium]
MNVLFVGAGGFAGSALRYILSGLVHRLVPFSAFPYGTLAVNILGCLGIGLLTGLGEIRQVFGPELRLFLFLGLLGGLTTFSTFSYETMALIRDAQQFKALANIALHLLAGLSSVWAGLVLARSL